MSNQEHPPFGKPEGSMSLATKIGLAVFLAILAVTAIRWLYANWVMQQAVESFNQSISRIQAQSQAQLAAIQLREQQRREHEIKLKALEIEQRMQEQEDACLVAAVLAVMVWWEVRQYLPPNPSLRPLPHAGELKR